MSVETHSGCRLNVTELRNSLHNSSPVQTMALSLSRVGKCYIRPDEYLLWQYLFIASHRFYTAAVKLLSGLFRGTAEESLMKLFVLSQFKTKRENSRRKDCTSNSVFIAS